MEAMYQILRSAIHLLLSLPSKSKRVWTNPARSLSSSCPIEFSRPMGSHSIADAAPPVRALRPLRGRHRPPCLRDLFLVNMRMRLGLALVITLFINGGWTGLVLGGRGGAGYTLQSWYTVA